MHKITLCPPGFAYGHLHEYSARANKRAPRLPIKFYPNLNPDWRMYKIGVEEFMKSIPEVYGSCVCVSMAKFLQLLEAV